MGTQHIGAMIGIGPWEERADTSHGAASDGS